MKSQTVSVLGRGFNSRPMSNAKVAERAQAMLSALGREDAELSVLLCGDHEIQELNRQYRGKDRPTDVLAFSLQEGESVQGQADLLGDVVISVETARRQAREKGHSSTFEITFLLAHGLLHLLGYDHVNDADERKMQKKTQFLMSLFA